MADIQNSEHNVFVAGDDWLQMIEPEIAALGNLASSDYGQLFQQSSDLMQAGSERAFMVPAVLFLVRSSVRILAHQDMDFQLPLEITSRAEVAHSAAEALAKTRDVWQAVNQAYWSAGFPTDHPNLSDENLWEMLNQGVFKDTAAVTGGAFKLLEEQAPQVQDRQAVIQRSSGLLAISRLVDEYLPYAYDEIGYPYINVHNLALETDNQGLKVRFKPAVLAGLKDKFLSLDGCPAAKQKGLNSRGNLMQEGAKPVITYLTPPGATVDLYKEVDTEPDIICHLTGIVAKRQRLAELSQTDGI